MKTIKLMSMLLASLVLGACSSSDSNSDDNGNGKGNGNNSAYTETILSEPPTWQIDWNYNQERPSWTEPDATLYENWTILKVLIEDELKPYTSEGDMMALFVNGELRGMATPAVIVGSNQVENGKFVMKAWGNETGSETVNISLQYYSQTLKHIFTLSDVIKFSSDLDTGIESDYIPAFTSGSAKYPVMKTVIVESILTRVGITPVQGNVVSAFVGEECRGTEMLSPYGNTSLTIYGSTQGESVTLKYYDAATGHLFTIPDIVKM